MPKGVQQDVMDATVRRIKGLCRQRKWTNHKLSTEAGISAPTIHDIMNKKQQNISLRSLKSICDAFGISMTEFFDTAYFRNLPIDADDEE